MLDIKLTQLFSNDVQNVLKNLGSKFAAVTKYQQKCLFL